VSVIKLYESKDASINVGVEFKASRFLFGFAYTEAPFTLEVRMRMVALHVWCCCFTFTRFYLKQATKAEVEAEARRRGRDLRTPTRQSGRHKRKRL
jgi:hypothetical protein